MDKPLSEKVFNDVIYMYLAFLGKHPKSDGMADFVTVDNGRKTAYFLSHETAGSAIEKANRYIDIYDEVYLIFDDEKKYTACRTKIPKRIGVILYGDPYGFGKHFSVQRKANNNGGFG